MELVVSKISAECFDHIDCVSSDELGIKNLPIWTREVSFFDWTYDDQETCSLLEGEVTVTPDGEEPLKFGAGDLVVFPAGMDCRWDIHKAVRKHYRFGD